MRGDFPVIRNCPDDGKTQTNREESKSICHQEEHAPNYRIEVQKVRICALLTIVEASTPLPPSHRTAIFEPIPSVCPPLPICRGSEQQLLKNQRKAERLIKEIEELKVYEVHPRRQLYSCGHYSYGVAM